MFLEELFVRDDTKDPLVAFLLSDWGVEQDIDAFGNRLIFIIISIIIAVIINSVLDPLLQERHGLLHPYPVSLQRTDPHRLHTLLVQQFKDLGGVFSALIFQWP